MKGSAFLLVMALLPMLTFANCIGEAARFHRVGACLVRAIAQVESRVHADAVGVDNDGSTNIGLMQASSSQLPSLARYGITRAYLFDAYVNAHVGGWALSRNIQQLGLTWDAVGAYNAKSPAKCFTYARKIYQTSATTSPMPSHAIANPIASVQPVEAPRAAARHLQTNTPSDITIVS